MTSLNLSHLLFVLFFSFIGLKSQESCTSGSTIFIRQNQLDSFLILNPNCVHVDKIDIFGQNITNLKALRNLKNIDYLSIRNTKINSLAGLENLERSKGMAISQNKLLSDLNVLNNLHFSNIVSITNNDSLTSFDGLSGDSLMTIIIEGNKNVKNLTGLESSFCHRLHLFNINFNSYSGHNLEKLKILYLANITTLNSLDFNNLDSIKIELSPKIFSLDDLSSLLTINTLELYLNENLSECSTDLICKKLEDTTFSLVVALNTNGCNSKEEIKEKCISNTMNELNKNEIEIYPQPFTNDIYFKGLKEPTEYKITNLEGKIIQIGQTERSINACNLSEGFYVLHLYLKRNDKEIKTFKMIKI
jgi:hypothetical protein